MTRLSFAGQQPISFMGFPYLGEVEPGIFEARDEDAKVLLLRSDVEPVEDADAPLPEPAVPAKPRKSSTAKPADVKQDGSESATTAS